MTAEEARKQQVISNPDCSEEDEYNVNTLAYQEYKRLCKVYGEQTALRLVYG